MLCLPQLLFAIALWASSPAVLLAQTELGELEGDAPGAPDAPMAEPAPADVMPSKPPTPTPSPSKPKPLPGRLGELNLSPEQTNAIIELRKQWKNDPEKKLKDELRIARQALTQAMSDTTPQDEVRRRFETVQKKYLELQTLKFDRSLKIREVLNAEQRKKLQDMRSKIEN
jgi:Spy/CpxP family protein refolding chaperone